MYLLLVFFFQSSLAVALFKADLVLVLSCSPPLHTVTSLLSPPPISSSPIPSLLTCLFRFPIVKGMSRMSLTLYLLTIHISFFIS
ncbi:hypothetical protein F4604DRAFT_1776398 [Suillus subluteus]|nr:hypothetical protein F4604DRAFT_1776398 [Suillus subluteus]